MTEEKDRALVAKYPKLFRDRYGNMMETCMCWGFECGDGWYYLIDNLCKCIQSYIDSNHHLEGNVQIYVTQVKEKYGTLRFYTTGGDDRVEGMIWFAEYLSSAICEECGNPGEIVVKGGWYMTRCPEHSPLTSIKDEDVIEE